MQKKIIALAVAGLVSGAAFAQSNVTVYGIADVAYQFSSSSYVDGVKSQSAINDGGQDGSRVGFKGTEDLGNGLKAFFQLEQRFHLDATANNEDGDTGLAQRNSNVGLMGNWGTVKAGSFGSVHDDYNGYSEAGGMGWGNGVFAMLATVDARNAVEYISPNMSGLEFKVGVSTSYDNVGEVEAIDDLNDNLRGYFASAAYANGGLKAALTVDRAKYQTESPDKVAKTEWLASVGYDFGVVKVGAGYDRNRTVDNDIVKTWRVNIGAPISANDAVALSYSRQKLDHADAALSDSKGSGWGVSYSHAMSKRTNIYATYGHVSLNSTAEAEGDVEMDGAGTYRSAFKVGMRHFF